MSEEPKSTDGRDQPSADAARPAPRQADKPPASDDSPPAFAPPTDESDKTAGHDDQRHKEELLWVGRTSWKHFAGRILLWLLGSIAVIILVTWLASAGDGLSAVVAFWIAAVPIALAGLWIGGKVIKGVYGQRYRLSDERLFIDRGLLSQTIDQTELIRVDDVRVHKAFLDRILGLGTVEILSTDLTDSSILVVGIQRSEDVAEAIRSRMRSMRKKSLFVESL